MQCESFTVPGPILNCAGEWSVSLPSSRTGNVFQRLALHLALSETHPVSSTTGRYICCHWQRHEHGSATARTSYHWQTPMKQFCAAEDYFFSCN